jgi:hypothetical protein
MATDGLVSWVARQYSIRFFLAGKAFWPEEKPIAIGCAHSDSLGGKKLSAGWTGPLSGALGCSHLGDLLAWPDEIFPQRLVLRLGGGLGAFLALGRGAIGSVSRCLAPAGYEGDDWILRVFLAFWYLATGFFGRRQVKQRAARPRTLSIS